MASQAGPNALLWVPAIVAGAFNAGRNGSPSLFAPLQPVVDARAVPASS